MNRIQRRLVLSEAQRVLAQAAQDRALSDLDIQRSANISQLMANAKLEQRIIDLESELLRANNLNIKQANDLMRIRNDRATLQAYNRGGDFMSARMNTLAAETPLHDSIFTESSLAACNQEHVLNSSLSGRLQDGTPDWTASPLGS